jgi:ribonuclease HI
MTEWMPGWVAKGWKKAKGGDVENRDLWERLYTFAAGHEVSWRWVKGHAGNAGNEQADELANRGLTLAQHQ